jgi:hypothetical protein
VQPINNPIVLILNSFARQESIVVSTEKPLKNINKRVGVESRISPILSFAITIIVLNGAVYK